MEWTEAIKKRSGPHFRAWNNGRTYTPRRCRFDLEALENRYLLSASGGADSSSLISPEQLAEQLAFRGDGVQVSEGLWWLGTGPRPEELQLRKVDNAISADTAQADQIWASGASGLNLTGRGVTVGVWDDAQVRATHRDLTGRVTIGDQPGRLSNHGTHIAGTIAGAGIWPTARGFASEAQIVSYDWDNDLEELAAAAAAGLSISNHSYGDAEGWLTTLTDDIWLDERDVWDVEDPSFGKYSATDASLDALLHQNPNLLSVWSAGNDRIDGFTNARRTTPLADTYLTYLRFPPVEPSTYGPPTPEGWYRVSTQQFPLPPNDGGSGLGYDTLGPGKTAKNNLVVGSIGDWTQEPIPAESVETSVFSSWGPTDDGRIKPDLVANGEGVWSTFATGNAHYSNLSGTSQAAPAVAGVAALMTQLYRDTYDQQPSAAALKGLLLHTALDIRSPGPDYQSGWGVVDAKAAADFLIASSTETSHALWNNLEFTGSEHVVTVELRAAQDLKSTIVWNDLAGEASPEGLDPAGARLVNDLNLWIEGPDGGIHFPWSLNPAEPSSPAVRDRANHVDNVEQVLIDNAPAGIYKVHIGSERAFEQSFTLLANAPRYVDITPPTAVVLPVQPNPTDAQVDSLTIQFSEPVVGFTLAQLRLTRESELQENLLTESQTLTTQDQQTFVLIGLSPITAENGRYTITVSGAEIVQDAAGNVMAEGAQYTWLKVAELTPPVASVAPIQPNPTDAAQHAVTIRFSEPVAGFDIADIALYLLPNDQTNLLTGAQQLSSIDETSYSLEGLENVTVSDGTYRLVVRAANAEIVDASGNALAFDAVVEWRKTTDVEPPSVVVLPIERDVQSNKVHSIRLQFSEPVVGFDLADLHLDRVNDGQGELNQDSLTLNRLDDKTYELTGLEITANEDGLYVVTLRASQSNIYDEQNNPLANSVAGHWRVSDTDVSATVNLILLPQLVNIHRS